MSASDTPPLELSEALLRQVAQIAQPHGQALLEDIRAVFGDQDAPTLYAVAQAMALGATIKTIAHADRTPNAVALVWSLMGVPFSLEAKRVQ